MSGHRDDAGHDEGGGELGGAGTLGGRLTDAFVAATDEIEPAADGWERISGRLGERPDDRSSHARAASRPRMFLVAAAALVVVVLGAGVAFVTRAPTATETATLTSGSSGSSGVAFGPATLPTGSSGPTGVADGPVFAYDAGGSVPSVTPNTGRFDGWSLPVTASPTPRSGTIPAPSVAPARSIVAITADDRLVELDGDGREVRQIYAPATAPGQATPERSIRGPISVSAVDRTIYVERSVPSSCDRGYVAFWDVVGEIVAIPFAGGEPRVVVTAGTRPAIARNGTSLAYVAPADGSHCSGSHNEWVVKVNDVVGLTAFGASPPLSGTTVFGGEADGRRVDPLAPVDVAWAAEADALVVRARRPDAENLAGRCPTCGPTTYAWVDGHGAAAPTFGADIRTEGAVVGPPDRTDDEREVFDTAAPAEVAAYGQEQVFAGGVRGDGRVAVASTTIDLRSFRASGDRPLFDIDPSVLGDGRYVAASLDATSDGTRALVLATAAPTVENGGRTRSVILWDGSSVRLLRRDVLAVAWAEGGG